MNLLDGGRCRLSLSPRSSSRTGVPKFQGHCPRKHWQLPREMTRSPNTPSRCGNRGLEPQPPAENLPVRGLRDRTAGKLIRSQTETRTDDTLLLHGAPHGLHPDLQPAVRPHPSSRIRDGERQHPGRRRAGSANTARDPGTARRAAWENSGQRVLCSAQLETLNSSQRTNCPDRGFPRLASPSRHSLLTTRGEV